MIPALVVLGLAVAGFAARVATRPDLFRVERRRTLSAPPERIYPLIEDFHRWEAWSPWEKLDPQMKRTFEGAERGKGAAYSWEGNRKAGAGRMQITDAEANRRIVVDLHFSKPFEARNVTTFELRPAGTGTEVVWSMEGTNNLGNKIFQSVVNMDRLVGRDFERGLEGLERAGAG